MAGEERDDVVEHEEHARRDRTESEAERAAGEREAETGQGQDSVLPDEADEQRRGVMPPPEGAS
jgi:hypothetical protein